MIVLGDSETRSPGENSYLSHYWRYKLNYVARMRWPVKM